jgi:catechol 2,3-dioxygenase-like lactoylglutathione lyase family enzyme
MYDHIGLQVKDLAASRRFYAAALAPLDLVADSSGSGFGPEGAPALWLYQGSKGGAKGKSGTHVALRAGTRKAVDRFHAAGLKAGGRDNGAPGLRVDYSPSYYAAFLIDPDGNNVEAVCMEPR